MIAQISMQNFIKFQSLQVNTRNVFLAFWNIFTNELWNNVVIWMVN